MLLKNNVHVYCTWYKSLSRTLDRAIVSFVKILLAFQMQYNISSKQWHFMPLHKGPLLVWHTEHIRDSERMSYKQSVIFIPNLAYVAHFSQNHPIFLYISTKISLKKVISTDGSLRCKTFTQYFYVPHFISHKSTNNNFVQENNIHHCF